MKLSNALGALLVLTAFISACSAFKVQYYQETFTNGVNELQVIYKNLKFKETYVKSSFDEPSGIVIRRLTNGRQVVTLVYNGTPFYYDSLSSTSIRQPDLSLKECKVEKGHTIVEEFDGEFNKIPFSYYTDDSDGENSNNIFSEISLRNIASNLGSFSKFKQLKTQCFSLHRKLRRIVHKKRSHALQLLNNNSSEILNRNRRGLEEVLILPGTKWCGSKRLARSYQDLDGHVSTDTCCRDHDMCPLSIPLLTKKYGMYNNRFTAVSHCACDKRFRTCLKQASTGASDIVGKVFFNFVRSRCFVFQKKRICLKYGLWNCFKWGYRVQAVIKDNSLW